MQLKNSYEDEVRATNYAQLDFPNTYFLAYRDLASIIARFVAGRRALDFGCGTGRSTRFLHRLGLDVVGIDISDEMLRKARALHREGDFRLVYDGDFSSLPQNYFHLVLSVFTFDNIPSATHRLELMVGIYGLLRHDGIAILVDSTPELYTHEWASFTTKDFPDNRNAKSGDVVRVIMTDVDDRRPVEDVVWYDKDYRTMFRHAGLQLVQTIKPLARSDEPYVWVNETSIPPWVIYVVKRSKEAEN